MPSRRNILTLLVAPLVLMSAGCKPEAAAAPEVVIYTSVDQQVAEPILRDFENQTGVKVRIITDTEATKSAGLAARLLAEKANPQADVYWGNEVFHTINLARNGVLTPFQSPEAATIPPQYKDAGNLWAGTCLRARVIAVAGTAEGGISNLNLRAQIPNLISRASSTCEIPR